jgi:hypothetical protein
MGLFGKTKTTLVVDVTAILKSKGVRGRAAPRQQIQILQTLARFVRREKLNVTAVIVGQTLNKAPHNRNFEGVRVRYAKSDGALVKELLKALKQAGKSGVLVVEDVALEKRVHRAGGQTLRVSTFRKTLDEGNEPSGDNRQRPPRRERGPRPDRAPQPEKTREAEGDDAISQMIDLVE